MFSQFIRSCLLRVGLALGRTAPKSDVTEFLSLLKPVRTEAGLIRIGGPGDGGYLVPDDLEGIDACFSPGVSETATFEEALVQRSIPCYLADASVAASPFVHSMINFEPYYLDAFDGDTTITLESWITSKVARDSGDLILQMDIEGHEWSVILNTSSEVLSRFRIIVLELHHLDRICDRAFLPILQSCVKKLTTLFHVVHAHPNNASALLYYGDVAIPPLLEITLYRRDRGIDCGPATQFPHPLDEKNVARMPDIRLPQSLWTQIL